MQIAMIGAGKVGLALGRRLRDVGHDVTWGVRDPSDPKYSAIWAVPIEAAAAGAEVVVLAVPWSGAKESVAALGNLDGKTVVDAINPISEDFSGLLDLGGKSAGELLAEWLPGAAVVKAFNSTGYNIMENPLFGDMRATMLIAGDNQAAKDKVMGLASDIGYDPIDTGPISMSRYLEAMAWIWIDLATKQGMGRDIAFRLMRRS